MLIGPYIPTLRIRRSDVPGTSAAFPVILSTEQKNVRFLPSTVGPRRRSTCQKATGLGTEEQYHLRYNTVPADCDVFA